MTGTQGGKPVRFSTTASFKDAEHGNSFIPRLWARMHLDSLLDQGRSAAIKDEIIGLSEEFQIITPYTSLLVLETDADRERFKVKRRFQMRDGERFFADARDSAVFDLAQKQRQKAGNWRTALRRAVLSELAGLGRDPRLFQRATRYDRMPRSGKEQLWSMAEPNSGTEMLSGLQVPMGDLAPIDGQDRDEFARADLGDVDGEERATFPGPGRKAAGRKRPRLHLRFRFQRRKGGGVDHGPVHTRIIFYGVGRQEGVGG